MVRIFRGLLYLKLQEHDWVSVKDNEIWKFDQNENGILSTLSLCYNDLPFH